MKKERPTWATVVGIIGIIFSCLGILGAGYVIWGPNMIAMEKEMIANMENIQNKTIQKEGSTNVPIEEFFEMFKSIESVSKIPEWYGTFTIVYGILKFIICGFGLFASICLLQTKPSSIKLFYWSAGLNIGLVLLKMVTLLAFMSFMAIVMIFGGFSLLVVNIILILVVALGNKTAFIQGPPPLNMSNR